MARGIAVLIVSASVACGSSGSKPGSALGPGLAPSDSDADTPGPDADVRVDGSACAGSADCPGLAPSDSDADTPGLDADVRVDGSACVGSADCAGVACDERVAALCVDGQWTCNGIPAAEAGSPGCECYDALTMGLAKCCPSLDGGANTTAYCAIPDGGQGKLRSGTLACSGGGTPYVAEAGASCR
jgi:hypothetical protein